jgi:hypothetical protein
MFVALQLEPLTALEELRLDTNLLTGSIPSDLFVNITELRHLLIGPNNFNMSAGLPTSLDRLTNLIEFGGQGLLGEIPLAFATFENLHTCAS